MADFHFDPNADDQSLLNCVVDYYHRVLVESPSHHLRFASDDAIRHFRIGFADRSLGTKLPLKQLKPGRLLRERLQAVGLYRDNGREKFRGCITVPVMANGRVVDVYGRKLGPRLRAGTQRDEFLADERRGVWNATSLEGSDDAILCSNVFDALVLWSHGHHHVTCLFGTGVTQDHLTALANAGTRRVLVFDESLGEVLLSAGLDCFHVRLPIGVTLWEYAGECSDPADAMGTLLRKASWMGKGLAPTIGADSPLNAEQATPQADAPTLPATSSCIPTKSLIATPAPSLPEPDLAEVRDDEMTMTFGDRRYRVRGWTKNLAFDVMRVNLMVGNPTGLFVDTLDLYSAKHRRGFIVQAVEELGVQEATLKKDLGRLLLTIEELQDRHVANALQPKEIVPEMTAAERDDAMGLLCDPNLLDRIAADFEIVGEETNKLVAYLAAVSRKLDDPLAIVIQSSSAAGKSTLLDAVLDFMPAEDVIKYSAMTGQSLYYMSDGSLKHRILALVEEEGAAKASYALKLLQSEQELRIASTGKEAKSGRLTTQEYRVEGPVMLCLTTTAITLDEELLNRCIVLSVGEDREQTRAIHALQRQRQTLEGMLRRRERGRVLIRHRNAQRLLRPLLVVNPFASTLTFRDDQIRARRDHVKYLTLIRAVAMLYQYQRPTKTVERDGRPVEYIEVVPDDIAIANRLMLDILGQSMDELPPPTRCLLERIHVMVDAACREKGVDRSDYRFTRRHIRDTTRYAHSQLAVHLSRLEQMEYLLVHRGGRGRSIEYELLYAGNDRERWLPGLVDVERLRRDLPALSGEFPGSFRPPSGQLPATFRAIENGVTANGHGTTVKSD